MCALLAFCCSRHFFLLTSDQLRISLRSRASDPRRQLKAPGKSFLSRKGHISNRGLPETSDEGRFVLQHFVGNHGELPQIGHAE